jgi:hypothetical protein
MPDTPQLFTFVRLSTYVKAATELLTDVEERAIEETLRADPRAGDTIADSGGVAKLRVKLPGRGKSGGARVIYFYRGSVGRIYLIYVYVKGKQDTLTANEKKMMREITTAIEGE